MKRVVGVVLILAGLLGFVFISVAFTAPEERTNREFTEVEQKETATVPVGRIASGAALVVGVALVGVLAPQAGGRLFAPGF